MSTYQAASGAGAEGMAELENGIKQFVKGEKVTNEFFAYPLPFNVIPQVGGEGMACVCLRYTHNPNL